MLEAASRSLSRSAKALESAPDAVLIVVVLPPRLIIMVWLVLPAAAAVLDAIPLDQIYAILGKRNAGTLGTSDLDTAKAALVQAQKRRAVSPGDVPAQSAGSVSGAALQETGAQLTALQQIVRPVLLSPFCFSSAAVCESMALVFACLEAVSALVVLMPLLVLLVVA